LSFETRCGCIRCRDPPLTFPSSPGFKDDSAAKEKVRADDDDDDEPSTLAVVGVVVGSLRFFPVIAAGDLGIHRHVNKEAGGDPCVGWGEGVVF
jgi:hypothetical protein